MFEHIEYTPYGETWIDKSDDFFDMIPYKYTDPFGLCANDAQAARDLTQLEKELGLSGSDSQAMAIPEGVSAAWNIISAERMSPFEFYDAVKNGGMWDYKQQGTEYQNFGNFNYGVTGTAAGFSEEILKRAAGFAQIQAGTSKEEWGNPLGSLPYGDDPEDQKWIQLGIDYARGE